MNYEETTSKKQVKERVIDRILKQLTPENRQKQIKEIQEIELPLELQKWIQEYEKVSNRDPFIWKWIHHIIPLITLPIVTKEYQKSVVNTKSCALIVFAVLFNDAADILKNKHLLNELLKIPFLEKNIKFDRLNQQEREYLIFTKKLWEHVLRTAKQYPRYQEFRKFFDYDILQILMSNEYDYLVATNHSFGNRIESWLYPPHTMGGMVCADFDLMCSHQFDIKDLGKIREIVWHAQKMARIGNWISTWEREIDENDFTSKVFIDVVNLGILTIDKIKKENKQEIIQKIKASKIEEELLDKWENSYKSINSFGQRIKSFNSNKLLQGLEDLLVLELNSRKYK